MQLRCGVSICGSDNVVVDEDDYVCLDCGHRGEIEGDAIVIHEHDDGPDIPEACWVCDGRDEDVEKCVVEECLIMLHKHCAFVCDNCGQRICQEHSKLENGVIVCKLSGSCGVRWLEKKRAEWQKPRSNVA